VSPISWTSPRTWLAGEDPAASVYNQHIRDNFKAIGDAWTSYSPAWAAATTNPVIGNGTKTGAYIQVGKLIMFRINITAGSTTTWGSGVYTFSYPPFAPLDSGANSNPGITGFFFDNSGGPKPYGGFGIGQTSTTFRVVMANADSYMSHLFPVAGAVSDKINLAGTYEAA